MITIVKPIILPILGSNTCFSELTRHHFCTMVSDDIHKISLIKQCQFLEDGYDTSFVADCLNDPENAHLFFKEARAFLLQKDWTLVLDTRAKVVSIRLK